MDLGRLILRHYSTMARNGLTSPRRHETLEHSSASPYAGQPRMVASLARVSLARVSLARVSLARVSLARVSLARVSLARVSLARVSLARVSLAGAAG